MPRPFTSIHDRLREARVAAGFDTAADAARAWGWRIPTYQAHENGNRGVPSKKVRLYAGAFKVNPMWLLTGEGDQDIPKYAGIKGKIGAGAQILPGDNDSDLSRELLPPSAPTDSMIGFHVMGDSMYPVYRDGDIVFVGDQFVDIDQFVGRECAVQEHDGPCYLKTIERGSTEDRYNLISYNAPPIRDVRIDWARPVLFVKRA